MQKLGQFFNNLSFGLKIGSALVLVGVVPIAIVSFALVTSASNALQSQTLDKMSTVGKSRQAILESFFQARADEAAVLAERESVKGNAQNTAGLPVFWKYKHDHADTEYLAAYQTTITGLQNDLQTHSEAYLDILVYDRIGDRVAQATDPDQTDTAEAKVTDQPFFVEAMNGAPYFGDITENPLKPGEQMYIISYPITQVGTTDPIGVVAIKGNPAAVDALLNNPTGLGESGEVYLVNGSKLMITNTRLENTPTRLVTKVDDYPVQQALAGKTNVSAYADYRGETDLGYYAPFPGHSWALVAEIDQSEALAPVRQQTEIALVLVAVALLTALGLAAVLSGFLGRQVNEIQKVFRAAAIGNFDARARVFGLDELGKTADGVNAMLERLTEILGLAAKTAQQRFSDVVTTMADWVWEVNSEGRYTYVSDNVMSVLGYTPAEMLGKTPFDFMAPEEAQRVGPAFTELLAARKPLVELENKNLHKDGHEVIMLTNGLPILNDRGELTGYRGTDKDVTESRQAEARLRESESTLRSLFDNMQDAFYRSDKNGKLIWASPSAVTMMGYNTLEDVIGLDMATGFWARPEQRDMMIQELRSAGRVLDYEVEVRRKDGSTLPVSTSSSYYRDANGEIIGVEGTFRDITLRKQAEAQIEQQNIALGQALEELRGLMAGVETAAGQVTGASGSLQSIVELIAGQAAASADMAAAASSSAQEGGAAVTDTVSAMGRIRETTQETARRIKKLGEVSQEIGEVVRLIDEIADRVTVLALNASIQAAAAGDAGRGFAVVAEEVQRLAERATDATRQIENLIKGVQGEINEAMVSVEEVTQEVVGGSQLAQNAGDRMNDLGQVVNDLSNLIQHLSQTTTRQTAESLVTLSDLAENLRASVAALSSPQEEVPSGNGHGYGVTQ